MDGIAPPFPTTPEQLARVETIRAEERNTEQVATDILQRSREGTIVWGKAFFLGGWEYVGRSGNTRVLLSFTPRTIRYSPMTGAKFEIRTPDGKTYHELTHPTTIWPNTSVDELYDYVKEVVG